ncbi:MAG: FHA domain-containing protein [Planctomycetota bacterium]|jgi:pSer/pThr/pTyr-binding forkhead associated (FHA) protein/S1-C subfamily serine protease
MTETPRLIIEVLTSSLAGQRFTYNTSDLRFGVKIGRAPDSDIRFDANRDIKVSSHHASIDERSDGVFIADAGSSNGLYLNNERVTAEGSRIFDGDEVSFGQAGATARLHLPGDNAARPTVQFNVNDVDERPTETIDEDAPKGDLTKIVQAAGDAAGAGDKTRKMMKAVANALEESSQRKRAKLASKFAMLFIIAAVGVGVLVWQLQQTHQQDRNVEKARIDDLKDSEDRLKREMLALANDAKAREDRLRAEQDADIKRLQDQLGEDVTARLAEIQKERQLALEAAEEQNRKLLEAIEERKREVNSLIEAARDSGREVSAPREEVFQKITEQYNNSVFLIFVQYPILDKDGKQVGIEGGTGTGWLAKTSDNKAWVVTNKHVMHPYLFKPELVVSHAIRNVKPAPVKDWLISVWQPGTKLRPAIGDARISVAESWATLPGGRGGRGEVKIKALADNDMYEVGENYKALLKKAGFPDNLPSTTLKRVKEAKVHVMDTDKDLAILELQRLDNKYLSSPLPMATNLELKKLEQLDPVLALGYPLGLSVIKGTKVTTSPVLGVIRSLQWDVSVVGHSAPILPGNSGGPLISADGKVIGITTRRYEGTISEAISVSHARTLIDKHAK